MNFVKPINLESIVNKPTCIRNPKNSSYIDLVLTSKKERILNVKTVEIRLSDFHKMVVSVFKTSFKSKSPR